MAAMEPSFWSWEKSRPTESSSQSVQSPQWSPAFGAGKRPPTQLASWPDTAAMEPSFWSWEKEPQHAIPSRYRNGRNGAQLLELGKGTIHPRPRQRRTPQWSPAFGAGKRDRRVAAIPQQPSRNGAQLLELGKGSTSARVRIGELRRNGAQLLELGKGTNQISAKKGSSRRRNGAQLLELGKGHPPCCRCPRWPAAMEPSFWSWEKIQNFPR